MDERDDAALLQAVRDADAGALEELLRRHQERIYRFGLRMCRDEEDARDVVQETMLAVARSVERFRGDASFASWLFSIARNACARNRRRRAGQPEAIEPLPAEPLPAPANEPEGMLERRRLEAALEHAIASLPPKYREVVLLRDVEGLSANEVAAATGLSVAAIKSRLHRGRAELRETLRTHFGAEEPPRAGPEACPDVLAALSEHVEGDLEPSACAALERHVASCPRCASRCDALREVLAGCASLPGPRVPPAVEAAVRGALRDLLPR